MKPCSSEYASQVIVAKKRDGTLRICCVDYHCIEQNNGLIIPSANEEDVITNLKLILERAKEYEY